MLPAVRPSLRWRATGASRCQSGRTLSQTSEGRSRNGKRGDTFQCRVDLAGRTGKNKSSRRTIVLSAQTIAALKAEHERRLQEQAKLRGAGNVGAEASARGDEGVQADRHESRLPGLAAPRHAPQLREPYARAARPVPAVAEHLARALDARDHDGCLRKRHPEERARRRDARRVDDGGSLGRLYVPFARFRRFGTKFGTSAPRGGRKEAPSP